MSHDRLSRSLFKNLMAPMTVLLLIGAAAASTGGCELIATIDRSKIPDGAGGQAGSATVTSSVTSSATGAGGAGGQGGATSSTGTGGQGGAGGGTGCMDASTCPGNDTECQTRTCMATVCGFDFKASGTPLAQQTAGDCKTAVCDGAGATTTIDAVDPLDDANTCTEDLCVAGAPTNMPAPSGTPCTDPGGGTLCDGNNACVECLVAADCASLICQMNKCVAAGCLDTVKNGAETDVDCGGAICNGCANGKVCGVASDCASQVCTGGVCAAPVCTDTIKNGTETDVDCGGGACLACPAGKTCSVDGDCVGGQCSGSVCLVTCTDGVKNAAETDVDCGGPTCAKCSTNKTCGAGADCASGVCTGGVCQAASCTDAVKNAAETDVDCGGPTCAPCAPTKICAVAADCASGVCTGGICQMASCTDTIKNGAETDVDCGGGVCSTCAVGKVCGGGADCTTTVCVGNVCKTSVCGDGITNGAEACDDGNTAAGDGCSATCTVQPGYTCAGAPSVCTTTCGDGTLVGAETCDDGNAVAGDGCSSACAVEAGFICTGASPSVCTTICGDGIKAGVEACDDGNTVNTDGCSATCAVQGGFTCVGAMPSVCSTTCGDDILVGAETCDDGNTVTTDGCSAACAVQTGYTCTGAPSVCTTTCGDGVKAGTEACDDGNVMAGDGCSATCTVQSGFTCAGTAPSLCTTICGDGIQAGAEVCDDSNTASGDCCSSACQLEAGCEIEPNGAPATANSFSAIAISSQIKGALKPVADLDYFQITTTSVADIRIETFDGTGSPSCATGHDTEVRLFAANGTTQIVSDDDAGNGLCSLVDPALLPAAQHLPAGTYYVSVEEHGKDLVVADYILRVTFPAICGNGITEGSEQCDGGATCQADCLLTPICGDSIKQAGETCDDGNAVSGDGCSATCTWEFAPEAEPNNTCLTANGPQVLGAVGTSKLVSGALTPAQEQDWYGFTLTTYADVKFETFDSTGPLSCSPTTVDTQIQVFKSDCVTTQTSVQDQGGIGNCSRLDPAITASVRHLAPGTYFVKVYPYSTTATFAYTLQATVIAACGDGLKQGSEQCDGGATCQADCVLIPICGDSVKSGSETCDDGNTMSGDGCSATCAWETTAEVEPNGTTAQADVALPVITGNANITGAITPTTDKDLFKVVVAATSVVRFETFDPSGTDCTAAAMPASMRMTLLDSAGVTLKTDTVQSGIGLCPELTVLLSAGTYYIQVEKTSAGTVAGYFLQVRFQTDAGSEVEPNDTRLTATPMPGRDMHILGDHTVVTDVDWYQITLPSLMSIRAETIEGDVPTGPAPYNETCESNGIDSTIYLLNAAGAQLAINGDTGRGYCSQIDGTGAVPASPGAHDLAAGTYYLRVESYDTTVVAGNQFKYRLSVVAR